MISLAEELLGGGEVLALAGGVVESSADLSLIVGGDLLLEDVETLEDVSLSSVLFTGEDPDVLSLSNQVGVARVDDGDVLVVGVEDTVVTSGGIGEELDLALSADEGSDGLGGGNLILNGVVLAVQNSDGSISVEGIVSLLAIVGFPRHGGVSCLLVPETHVLDGVEVLLENRCGARAGRDASVDNADESEGSEDNSLEHDFD